MKYLLGYKRTMTQIFLGEAAVPVTIIEIPQNVVCNVAPADGSGVNSAIDIGIGEKKQQNSAEKGKYSDIEKVPSHIWTIFSEEKEVKSGTTFGSEIISDGDIAEISGITKGKGFAGVVKRWGFHGGPKTHGQSDRHRAPGSIGAGTDPGRIWVGTKMGGKMGATKQTLTKRKVVKVGDGFIMVKGPVPGHDGSLLRIKIVK